jgi:hypothetical protein
MGGLLYLCDNLRGISSTEREEEGEEGEPESSTVKGASLLLANVVRSLYDDDDGGLTTPDVPACKLPEFFVDCTG